MFSLIERIGKEKQCSLESESTWKTWGFRALALDFCERRISLHNKSKFLAKYVCEKRFTSQHLRIRDDSI